MNETVPAVPPRISMLGSAALLVEAAEALGEAAQRRIWHVATQSRQWPGVRESVPGMNNLMLVFDAQATTPEAVTERVTAAWQDSVPAAGVGKLVDIPVHYGGDGGPDLLEVANHAGLDIDAVVRLHSEATYTVYFLGAHPGFAYLGGLHEKLHTPRRAQPRLRVPQGTLAIGGVQTGVIAQTSPSGWQLIGTTDLRFFDPAAQPPTVLEPGDRVRFRPIGVVR